LYVIFLIKLINILLVKIRLIILPCLYNININKKNTICNLDIQKLIKIETH